MAGLCALALGSCDASLEKAQLAFTPDSSGVITLRVAGEADEDDISADEVIAQIQNCGFKGRHFPRGADIVIDAQYEFANQTIMNSNLDCLPLQWTRREVSIDVSKGLLWTSYLTRVWIEQPKVVREEPAEEQEPVDEVSSATAPDAAAADAADGIEVASLPEELGWEGSYPLFPIQLTVRVPGTIDAVSTEGTDLTFAEVSHEFANNRATIDMALPKPGWSDADSERHGDQLDALIAALESGKTPEIPLYVYKVEIESSESHFNLSSILAVLGLLFGSGLVGRLFALRAARRKAGDDS